MNYDIFISYRREGGAHYARILKAELEKRGYRGRVFLDYDELKDGQFNHVILNAIKSAPVFIFIMTPGALDRCSDANDWVRREIECAFKCERHIIPVNFDRMFTGFSADTPEIIKAIIGQHQFSSIDTQSLLNASIDELIKFRIAPVVAPDTQPSVFDLSITDDKADVFDPDFEEAEVYRLDGDYASALMPYLNSIKNGNDIARDRLYEILVNNGHSMAHGNDEFWNKVKDLEQTGDKDALLLMHILYYELSGDREAAVSYLKRALNNNPHPAAFMLMGRCYGWGLGVRQNNKLALHYFKKAVEKGFTPAYSYLGQTMEFMADDKENRNLNEIKYIYSEGIEKGDRRCYKRLFLILYHENKTGAETYAESLMAQGIAEGYTFMARLLAEKSPESSDQIERLLSTAIARKDKDAYGILSLRYYESKRYKEARQTATRGKRERDSLSTLLLGRYAEEEKDFATAWENYETCYDNYGINAEYMANLYLDYDYLPDSTALTRLKKALATCAVNQSIDAINALLCIIVKEKTGKDDTAFTSLEKCPETFEYIKMGAECNDPYLTYCYGKLMLCDGSPYINPGGAIYIFEKAARMKVHDALCEVLFYYRSYNNTAKLREWADFAIDNNIAVTARDYLTDKEAFKFVIDNTSYGNEKLLPYICTCYNAACEIGGYHFTLFNTLFDYIKRGVIKATETGDDGVTIKSAKPDMILKLSKELLGKADSTEEFHVGYLRRLRPILPDLFDFNPLKAATDNDISFNDLKLFYALATQLKGDDLIFDYLVETMRELFNKDKSLTVIQKLIDCGEERSRFCDVYYYSFYKEFEREYSAITPVAGTEKPRLEPFAISDIAPVFSPVKAVSVNMSVTRAVIYLSSALHGWLETVEDYISNASEPHHPASRCKSVFAYYRTLYPDAPRWLSYAECIIDESCSYFENARRLTTASLDNEPALIAEYLNKGVEFLKSHDIETDLPHYHSHNIPKSLLFDSDNDDD